MLLNHQGISILIRGKDSLSDQRGFQHLSQVERELSPITSIYISGASFQDKYLLLTSGKPLSSLVSDAQ